MFVFDMDIFPLDCLDIFVENQSVTYVYKELLCLFILFYLSVYLSVHSYQTVLITTAL